MELYDEFKTFLVPNYDHNINDVLNNEYYNEYKKISHDMKYLYGIKTQDVILRTKIYRTVYILEEENFCVIIFSTKEGIIVKYKNIENKEYINDIILKRFNKLYSEDNRIFIPYNTHNVYYERLDAVIRYANLFIQCEKLNSTVISMKEHDTYIIFIISKDEVNINEYQKMWNEFLNNGGVNRELEVFSQQFVKIIQDIPWKQRINYSVNNDKILMNFWTYTKEEYMIIKDKIDVDIDTDNNEYILFNINEYIIDHLACFGVLKKWGNVTKYIFPLEGTTYVIIDSKSKNNINVKVVGTSENNNIEGNEIFTQIEYKSMNELQKIGCYEIDGINFSFLDLIQHIYNGNKNNPYNRTELGDEVITNIINEFFKYSGNHYLYKFPITKIIPEYILKEDVLVRFILTYSNKSSQIWTFPITCNIDSKCFAIESFSKKWTSGVLFRQHFCHPIDIMLIFKDVAYSFFKRCNNKIWSSCSAEQETRLYTETLKLLAL